MNGLKDTYCLVLDASAPQVFAGICEKGSWLSLQCSKAPALESMFQLLDLAFEEAKCALSEIDNILVCAGPGSVLGTRVSAITVRAWQAAKAIPKARVHQYESLAITAAQLEETRSVSAPFHVISESRNKRWNLLSATAGHYSSIREVETSELEVLQGGLFYLPQAKPNKDLPTRAQKLSYTLEGLPNLLETTHLIKTVESPEPFAHSAPSYQTWITQRHRGLKE